MEIVSNAKAKGGKALLVSVNKGFEEYDITDGTKVASVLTQTGGVTGATRLPDGTTALGMLTIIKIVGPTGAAVSQFNLPMGPELRAINRDPKTGHYWFSKMEYIYETDDQGNQLWKGYMGVGTKGYAVWWREGGGAYASTGEPASIVEVIDATTRRRSLPRSAARPMFSDPRLLLRLRAFAERQLHRGQLARTPPERDHRPLAQTPQVVEFAAPCGGAPGPALRPRTRSSGSGNA